jgi:hypothetical protein
MKKKAEVKWLKEPTDKDYQAAETYLQLLYAPKQVRQMVKRLKRAEMTEYAAKDLLRASDTSLLEIQAFDWTKQQKEIDQGTPLAPILIVRQENGERLIIADGFHRMCTVFAANQEITVPCKIVSSPSKK